MNRKEVNELISAKLWDRGFGKGKRYECRLNGEFVYDGISALRKQAKQGDHVSIDVYNKGYWWLEETVSFYVEPDEELVEYYNRIKGYRRTKVRDSQRQRVYNWEDHLPKGPKMQLRDIKNTVADIFDTYGYAGKEPRVNISGRKKVTSTYYPGWNEIRLAAGWGQYQRVVLHETAHALINAMGLNNKVASHGKEFVALFMELCELFLDGSAEDIEAARDRGQNLGTNYVRPEIVLTEDDIYGRLV